MSTGPTQNYGEDAATTWRARPVLAALVRATASCGPLVFALVVGAAAAHWLPPSRTGVPPELWLVAVVALSTGVLVVLTRWLRRLVPLSALLRLSLVLPDRVPHRFQVARRTWSPAALAEADGPDAAHRGAAERLLALVGALAAHDARTRTHGERVQAYAALIGRELGLCSQDVELLSWAALLHDVGKVHVPVDIINKNGRPSAQEWAALQEHPCHGGRLVQPLRSWLGPWLDGVEQHHERWDGAGYPLGLRGEDVSLSARIIAVADTYDAITSARSYKKPMSAEQARAEITRCAGAQFDPEVVRAFLSVGIGRLRLVAGPATLLAALPGVGALPAQALSGASAVAQTVGGQLVTVLVSAGVGVGVGLTATQALAAPPADLAVVEVADVTGAGPATPADPPAAPATHPGDPGTRGAQIDPATALPAASASGGVVETAAPGTPEALAGEVVSGDEAVQAPSGPSTSGPAAAGGSRTPSVTAGTATRPADPSLAPVPDRGAGAPSAAATGSGPTTSTPAPAEAERAAQQRAEEEKEKEAAERAAKDLAEAATKAEKDRAEKDRAEKDKAEKDKAEKDKAEKDKAEKEKAEKAAKDLADVAAKAAKDAAKAAKDAAKAAKDAAKAAKEEAEKVKAPKS